MSQKTRKEHEQEITYRLARLTDAVRSEESAKELRRKAIGCDVSAEACALAEKRLEQDLLPMGEGWK